MAKPRSELQANLVDILGRTDQDVWFQPPEGVQLTYPCIVYERDDSDVDHADNQVYYWMQRYQVTYIDKKPDSDVYEKLVNYPYSKFDRHFATSGLNHDVFVIYH